MPAGLNWCAGRHRKSRPTGISWVQVAAAEGAAGNMEGLSGLRDEVRNNNPADAKDQSCYYH